LYDYITKSAYAALSMQENNGAMPPGHNGPYYDPETPVRNTSHWLITFLKAYEITGDDKYKDAAYKVSKYLCSKEVRPMGATFWHRYNPKKDFCNGLIGQAWTIEALAEAAESLENPGLAELAAEVFLLHPFEWESGVWQRVAVDGMHLPVDGTFNHQLWFAAAGSLIMHCNEEVELRVNKFTDNLENLVVLYPSGLMQHSLKSGRGIERRLKSIVKKVKVLYKETKEEHKAIGYHQFNLYAFALLKRVLPEKKFWQSKMFNKMWSYANSEAYKKALDDNKFGYPYNPPGFEMAFALEVFDKEAETKQAMWLEEQFKRCFDDQSNLMVLGTEDSNTHAARIYEATRLKDIKFEI